MFLPTLDDVKKYGKIEHCQASVTTTSIKIIFPNFIKTDVRPMASWYVTVWNVKKSE